ncbi:hypothetical protein COCON_G00208970 [Conger conger]|uniref:Uncharacterized protein n=1 Tax=Conger conger TaxID=82655 RepID=A0A9Q1HNN9_CONCO|nr:hypothetical protein COCON_G00208970 [Conger conger]
MARGERDLWRIGQMSWGSVRSPRSHGNQRENLQDWEVTNPHPEHSLSGVNRTSEVQWHLE